MNSEGKLMQQHSSVICKFKLLCDKKWTELSNIAGETDVRFCGDCQSSVFLCRDYDSLEKHIAESHCVALETIDGDWEVGYPMPISHSDRP